MAHMIEQHDNMFSVGETPWHGLGKVLENAPGINEALEVSGLGWQVRTLDLTAHQPVIPGQVTRTKLHLPEFKALQRTDTQEVFTVVSSQYKVLQNNEAFDVFRPLVDAGDITLETAGSLQNGRKVWVLARITAAKDGEVKPGDVVKPFVMLSNSHDGTQAVRLGFTPIRVVCHNTLTLAHQDKKSQLVRVFHRGDLTGSLETLRDTLNLGAQEFQATIKQYRKLAKQNVSEADIRKYIRLVLALPEEMDKPTHRENSIIQVLLNGKGVALRKDQSDITWWDLYNSVNEWGLYHRGRTADARLNSMWFADGYTRDQFALQTALKLAA